MSAPRNATTAICKIAHADFVTTLLEKPIAGGRKPVWSAAYALWESGYERMRLRKEHHVRVEKPWCWSAAPSPDTAVGLACYCQKLFSRRFPGLVTRF